MLQHLLSLNPKHMLVFFNHSVQTRTHCCPPLTLFEEYMSSVGSCVNCTLLQPYFLLRVTQSLCPVTVLYSFTLSSSAAVTRRLSVRWKSSELMRPGGSSCWQQHMVVSGTAVYCSSVCLTHCGDSSAADVQAWTVVQLVASACRGQDVQQWVRPRNHRRSTSITSYQVFYEQYRS